MNILFIFFKSNDLSVNNSSFIQKNCSPSTSSAMLTGVSSSNQPYKGHFYKPSTTSEKKINQPLSLPYNNVETSKDHRQYICLEWAVDPKIMVYLKILNSLNNVTT